MNGAGLSIPSGMLLLAVDLTDTLVTLSIPSGMLLGLSDYVVTVLVSFNSFGDATN